MAVSNARRSAIINGLLPSGTAGASWALSASVGVASFVVYFLRSLPLANKVWAEDAIFLTNAYRDPVGSIFKPFNGYLSLVLGILALPLRVVAPDNAPLAIIIVTGVIFGLVAALTTHVASLYLRSVALAIALGLATVFVPILAQEAIAAVADMQFVLVYALFWMTLLPAPRRESTWIPAVLAVLIALSSPVAVAALPLALYVCWRNSAKRPFAAALVVGVVVQGVIHLSNAGGERLSSNQSAAKSAVHGVERLFASLAPHQLTDTGASRAVVALIVMLVITGTLCVLVAKTQEPRPALSLGLLAFASGVWYEVFEATLNHGSTDRYLLPSSLLIITAVIAMADEVLVVRRLSPASIGCATAAIVVILAMGANWSAGSWRRSSDAWDAAVARAAHQCVTTPALRVARISAGAFPWAVAQVPCSRL